MELIELMQKVFQAIYDIGSNKRFKVNAKLLLELYDYILEEDDSYDRVCPNEILKDIDFIYDTIYDYNPTEEERKTLYTFMSCCSNIAILDSLDEEEKEEVLPSIYKKMVLSEYYTVCLFKEDFKRDEFDKLKEDLNCLQVLIDDYLDTPHHESATLCTLKKYIYSKVDEIQERYNFTIYYPIK